VKVRVRHPTGAENEVDFQGTAVLGRDQSSQVVLHDPRCSRRHAVIEPGPQGMTIRDAGSANGIFVNGRKVESALLRTGDVIRLGDVQVTVLADVSGTVAMTPEDIAALGLPGGPGATAILSGPPPTAPAGARTAAPDAPPDAEAAAAAPSSRAATEPSLPVPPPPPPPEPKPAPVAPPPPVAKPAPAPVEAKPAPAPAPPAPAPSPAPAPPAAPPKPEARPAPPAPRPEPAAKPAPAPRPPRPAERPRRAGVAGPIDRPLTVTTISILWMLTALACAGGSVAVVLRAKPGVLWSILIVALGVVLAAAAGVMARGLLARAGWARFAQLALAVLGLFTPFFIPSAAVLMYMLRHDVGIVFSGRRDWGELLPDEVEILRQGGREATFSGFIAVSSALTVVAAGFVIAAVRREPPPQVVEVEVDENLAAAQVRAVIGAQDAFRGGTCGNGYADWEGLTNPAAVIPNYPAGAAPFLEGAQAPAEQAGYRFELTVEQPLPPAEGCPRRSFKVYRYSATPVSGKGRFFVAGPDRVIHVADGRPPTADDPPLPY
jgi:hypothetical protein